MIELHVGLHAVLLWQPGLAEPIAAPVGMVQGIESCLPQALGSKRRLWRPRVRVWLSSALARPFIVGPVKGLASWSEAQALAAAQAAAATGLTGECEVQLEDWPDGKRVLATAIDSHTLQWASDAVRDCGGRLMSMRPAWTVPLNRMIGVSPSLPLIGLEDDDGVSLLAAPGGGIDLAMTINPRPTADHLQDLRRRLALSHELDPSKTVHLQFDRAQMASGNLGWSVAAEQKVSL